jgi:hypothetical protein
MDGRVEIGVIADGRGRLHLHAGHRKHELCPVNRLSIARAEQSADPRSQTGRRIGPERHEHVQRFGAAGVLNGSVLRRKQTVRDALRQIEYRVADRNPDARPHIPAALKYSERQILNREIASRLVR